MSVYVKTDDKYIDGIDIEFPNDLITGIYLGNKVDKKTIEYILNLSNINEWKHLNIYQMEIDEISYKLFPRKLNIND